MTGILILSFCVVASLLSAGCSATLPRPSAKELYTQASGAFESEDYLGATDHYQSLLDQYPLNPYAEESQIKMAYAHYLDERYSEALAAFSDFERAYPTSAHMPFVQYYRGMSNFEQMRTSDRDQGVTRKAQEFFQDLMDRFPESAFARLAEEKSRATREVMAGHELLVADFNQTAGNLLATRARLRTVIEEYPETQATRAALARLEVLLNDEGRTELAALAETALALRREARAEASRSSDERLDDEDTDAAPTLSSSAVPSGLPPPGIDPLLLLVTQLKKQEDQARREWAAKSELAAKVAREDESQDEADGQTADAEHADPDDTNADEVLAEFDDEESPAEPGETETQSTKDQGLAGHGDEGGEADFDNAKFSFGGIFGGARQQNDSPTFSFDPSNTDDQP